MDISEGDEIRYRPPNGGAFPTGETTRSAVVEAIRGDELIVKQDDGFTNRIAPAQVV